MTLVLVDNITKTKGNRKREAIIQGISNIISGTFGSIGGCAMIGQTLLMLDNETMKNGSQRLQRYAGALSAILLLLSIIVLAPIIKYVPVSSLVGVMFNVVINTFEWETLLWIFATFLAAIKTDLSFLPKKIQDKIHAEKIQKVDALAICVTTIVTMLTNLAFKLWFCFMCYKLLLEND